jgi:hypothetical protein
MKIICKQFIDNSYKAYINKIPILARHKKDCYNILDNDFLLEKEYITKTFYYLDLTDLSIQIASEISIEYNYYLLDQENQQSVDFLSNILIDLSSISQIIIEENNIQITYKYK